MKRKITVGLLALALALNFSSASVLAEEKEPESEMQIICAGEEADETCAAETHSEGCPLYISETAPEEEEKESEGENKEAEANTYSVNAMPQTVMRQITSWADLKTAIESSQGETVVKISGEIQKGENDAPITIKSGQQITVEGSEGAAIVRPNKSATGEFVVEDGAALTVSGAIDVKTDAADEAESDLSAAHFAEVQTGGSLTVNGSVTAHSAVSSADCAFIYSKGKVTLKDGADLSGFVVKRQWYGKQGKGLAMLTAEGDQASILMEGGTISGCSNVNTANDSLGAAVQLWDGADFTMSGGFITDNGQENARLKVSGGGIYASGTGTEIIISGGVISGNTAWNGGGIYAANGTSVTMTGGSVSENVLYSFGTSTLDGGGIYIRDGVLTIQAENEANQPKICNNKIGEKEAGGRGAGIYSENTQLKIDGALISGNTMSSSGGWYGGGGICISGGAAEISNSEITGNVAGDKGTCLGGGIYSSGDKDCSLKISDTVITDNKSGMEALQSYAGIGGGLFVGGGIDSLYPVTIENCTIDNNQAGLAGAGIYAECASLHMNGSSVSNNRQGIADKTKVQGWWGCAAGGAYLAGCEAELTGTVISENTAQYGVAGGLYTDNAKDGSKLAESSVILTDCTVSGNTAPCADPSIGKGKCIGYGGGIFLGDGSLTLAGTTAVRNNSAGDIGDGVYVTGNHTVKVKDAAAVGFDNDVAVESGSYVTVEDKWSGADAFRQVCLTSQDTLVETAGAFGTPLVRYMNAAGGSEAAKTADEGHHFVPSKYMVNPDGTSMGLKIGASKIAGKTEYLTYVADKTSYVTLTFKSENGAWSDGSTEKAIKLPAGSTAGRLPELPVWNGYTFTGWNTSSDGTGEVFTDNTAVTKDITVYAQWKKEGEVIPDPAYKITYTDGVADAEIFKDQVYENVKPGSKTPAFSGTPAREGYIFKGWSPEVAETVTQDIVYTAQWEKKTDDGGSGEKPSNPGGTGGSGSSSASAVKAPKTGDETNLSMWLSVMLAAGGVLAAVVWFKRRTKK